MAIEGLVNRVILGDCQEILKKLDDNSIDFVFTDPPYGHSNNAGDLISRREAVFGGGDYQPDRDNRPILNDGIEADVLFQNMLREVHRVLKPGACICSCCPGGGGPDATYSKWTQWMDEVFDFKQGVMWDKGPMGMGKHYRRSYEFILVGKKQGAACKWYDETKKIENVIRHIRKIIPSRDQHPTIKPVALSRFFIELHSQPGEIVLDPFCGSGTTLVAAVQTGRRYIGIELDPVWHAVAEKAVQKELSQLDFFRIDPGPVKAKPKKVQSDLFDDEFKRKGPLN